MNDQPAQPTPRSMHWPILALLCRCGRELEHDGRRWGCGACGIVVDVLTNKVTKL